MIYKELGRTGEKVPAIGIGTWKLGADQSGDIAAIREGISLGMNMVDTAEMYHTESLVGEAIEGQGHTIIATKVSPDHLRYSDVIKACKQSLKNLGIKAIDLYQIHWPNPNIPISETMKAMEELVREGKVRYIGVSNFSMEEITEAQEAMKSNEIVSNQIEYSVLARGVDNGIVPFCQKTRITIIAYSPLARGYIYNQKESAYATLHKIANTHRMTISQVALNWVTSKPGVIAIPKASDIGHTRENAAACDFKLDPEDTKQIELLESRFRPISDRLNSVGKGSLPLISKLMEKRESLRKYGI